MNNKESLASLSGEADDENNSVVCFRCVSAKEIRNPGDPIGDTKRLKRSEIWKRFRKENDSNVVPKVPDKDERHKKKRKRISMQQKGDIITEVEKGETHKNVARKYGVDRTTISKLMKQREQILEELKELKIRCVKGTRKRIVVTSTYPFKDVDRATFRWITQVKANATQLNITGDMIIQKAAKFAQMLEVSETVSTGWLKGFISRYGISSVRRCGERRSFVVTDETCKPIDESELDDSQIIEQMHMEDNCKKEGCSKKVKENSPIPQK